MIRDGRYQASIGALDIEIRVERLDASFHVSGDITRDQQFIVGFRGDADGDADDRVLDFPVRYVGHRNLDTGRIRIDIDERGVGTLQLSVDLQGGLTDSAAGQVQWQGSRFRRLSVEIDGIAGTEAPLTFNDAVGRPVSLQSAYESAGFEIEIRTDQFSWIEPRAQEVRGWTPAEMHLAMEQTRTAPQAGRLQTHVFVCGFMAGRRNRGVLGIMYDWGENDRNGRAREGVAVFFDHPNLSDPRVPSDVRDREFTYTTVHELGHALNMLHSFDKARPSSLSWMNYPERFPLGHEAPPGHDGTFEFWSQFDNTFDAQELTHLRHGTRRELFPGGFEFGRYEAGLSRPFGGVIDAQRPAPGTNPLRSTFDVALQVSPLKSRYELGEPVFAAIHVANTSKAVQVVPTKLDPSEGYLTIEIEEPDGYVRRYKPPMSLCCQAERTSLHPAEQLTGHPGTPLFIGADGPLFTKPGRYWLRGLLSGINGFEIAMSQPMPLDVEQPTRKLEAFAERLWSTDSGLSTLYLRHPLANRNAWHTILEAARSADLENRRGNSTMDYMSFISALGWLTPFADLRGQKEFEVDADRALDHLKEVRTAGLPSSCKTRQDRLLKQAYEPRKKSSIGYTERLPLTREEDLDDLIPPSGLFGNAGLSLPGEAVTSVNPFERVVNAFRGTRRFADIVTWNIEHLHSENRQSRFRAVARLIRDMRCDFWALQEVDEDALERLVRELNDISSIDFDHRVVDGNGQQSGCVFRTDTTSVRLLEPGGDFFEGTIDVELRNGRTRTKNVFLRDPLLTEVRVRHQDRVFDFRAANVHLKSTDFDYVDRGNAHRTEAVKQLRAWMEHDRGQVSELDYFIFGDFNAETAEQGMGPLLRDDDYAVLSLGMQEEYGEDNSLTRVASQRTLDHIVITEDTASLMPDSDLGEQIVVRTDRRIPNFTRDLSDHIPVAARFLISG